MRFIPSQPDAHYPTFGSVFGLFSFQIGSVILYSILVPSLPPETAVGIVCAGVLTVLAGFLYGLYTEIEIPGAMRSRHLRRRLATRAAALSCVIALVPMVVFKMVTVNVLQFSSDDLYLWAYLIAGLFVMPCLELWMGIGLAAWLKKNGAQG